MTHAAENDDGAYAALLSDSLSDVTADLRTIDLVDLVSFIRLGSFAAIEDLIHSSVELFFKPGSLISAWTACVDMAWDSPPTVTLGLEFRHPIVSVFFDLLLGSGVDAVTVHAVLFEVQVTDAASGLALLEGAIADARLPRRRPGRTVLGSRLPSAGGRLLPR